MFILLRITIVKLVSYNRFAQYADKPLYIFLIIQPEVDMNTFAIDTTEITQSKSKR
jgi:hypothetical protein